MRYTCMTYTCKLGESVITLHVLRWSTKYAVPLVTFRMHTVHVHVHKLI